MKIDDYWGVRRGITPDIEKRLREIAKKYKYDLCSRGNNTFEIVRMVTNRLPKLSIDSRIKITYHPQDGLYASYELWTADADRVIDRDEVDEYNKSRDDFFKILENLVAHANKKFRIECLNMGEEPDDW